MKDDVLVRVRGLRKEFEWGSGWGTAKAKVLAVDDVSLDIRRGETVGIVGESGCGKSTLARLIVRLIEPTSGSVEFDGERLTDWSDDVLRKKRSAFQMIFQDPYASLNPRMRIRRILEEPLRAQKVERSEWNERIQRVIEQVGFPTTYLDRFAHELSGGQRQRVGIARALILDPVFVIGDEPVAALDVSIQAQVLNLLNDLRRQRALTCLFIAHDLSVVKYVSDRVGVMYLGQLVEWAMAEDVYREPLHPYTQLLMRSIPLPDPEKRKGRLPITGEAPSPIHRPSGCPFHTRCPLATDRCREERPLLREIKSNHRSACHHAEKLIKTAEANIMAKCL